jgi:hypothetical protein
MESNSATSRATIEHFVLGHVSFYFNIGRTEVAPMPTDPEGEGPGIRYRFRAFPFEEPAESGVTELFATATSTQLSKTTSGPTSRGHESSDV